MSQQTDLHRFFAVATPEEITQNDERDWAIIHSEEKAWQASAKVFAALHAEKSTENRRKNDARRARKYRACCKAAKQGSRKLVSSLLSASTIADHAACRQRSSHPLITLHSPSDHSTSWISHSRGPPKGSWLREQHRSVLERPQSTTLALTSGLILPRLQSERVGQLVELSHILLPLLLEKHVSGA